MTYKEEFKRKLGYPYEAFRDWLSRNHSINIGTLSEPEREAWFPEFLSGKRMTDFEEKYGFSRKSFASYVRRTYALNIGDLSDSGFGEFLDEYRLHRFTQDYSKEELIDVLKRYVHHAEHGVEIDLYEHEVPFIELLEIGNVSINATAV